MFIIPAIFGWLHTLPPRVLMALERMMSCIFVMLLMHKHFPSKMVVWQRTLDCEALFRDKNIKGLGTTELVAVPFR